jgi:hypothetical protein
MRAAGRTYGYATPSMADGSIFQSVGASYRAEWREFVPHVMFNFYFRKYSVINLSSTMFIWKN